MRVGDGVLDDALNAEILGMHQPDDAQPLRRKRVETSVQRPAVQRADSHRRAIT
jgi:hypothetical protein